VNFIVVGCGRVGAMLAYGLYKAKHEVTIIDFVGTSFEHLEPAYRGRMIEAEVLNEGALARAGIGKADGLAAVTNSDATNAVVARVARVIFKVPLVVSRNYDPRWLPLHEALGIQTVGSTAWGAQHIQELLCGRGVRSVFSPGNGEVGIYEFSIPESWHDRPVFELVGGVDCVVVALSRAGLASLPEADARLATDDIVHVSATLAGIETLRLRLEGQEG
jgi:trk system potassium uptake protein TrkA